jgi:transcriptional regulator
MRDTESMKRRDLLTGLALAGLDAKSQTRAGADPSLYIPKPQLVDDRKFLHDFMDEFAFVDLVTVAPTLRITHIPVSLDRTAGAYGTIHGHISRQNPQSATFDGRQTGVIVFHGPHGYISPTWYAGAGNVVPTWNFAVVHATGKLRPVDGKKELNDLLAKLIAKFESYEGTSYDFAKIDDNYKYGLMGGNYRIRNGGRIVGRQI